MSAFKKLCVTFCCGAFTLVPLPAMALATGVVNSAEICGACHGGAPTPGVTVTVDGPASLEVNQEAAYVVRIKGGPLAGAGFNLRVRPSGAASLIAGDGSRLEANELTHNLPRPSLNGEVVFPFRLKGGAHAATLTLSVVGNSVNLNRTPAGDSWNRTSVTVNLEEPKVEPDAGPPDSGQPDAGQPDAGQPDAGPADAGQPDAGVNVPPIELPDAGVEQEQHRTGCSTTGAASPVLTALAFALSARRKRPPRK